MTRCEPCATRPSALFLHPPQPHKHALHTSTHPQPNSSPAMSTNETISNKVGNATDGKVGEQTLLDQGKTLASHSIDYAKGVAGLGAAKPAASVDSAAHDKQGEHGAHTLGELINEGKDLAVNILATAQGVVAGASDKTKEVAGDAQASHEQQKPVGYVEQARGLAAQVIGTAQSIVGDAKASHEEGKPVGYVDQARSLAAQALGTAQSIVAGGQQKASETANATAATASDVGKKLDASATSAASDLSKQADQTKNTAAASLADVQKDVSAFGSAASKEVDSAASSAQDSINSAAASVNKKL